MGGGSDREFHQIADTVEFDWSDSARFFLLESEQMADSYGKVIGSSFLFS